VSGWRLGAAIGLAAAAVFAAGIHDGSFVDEYAYITQSYYADLFLGGRLDDRAWIDYPALDLPPLPKYFIGTGLLTAHIRRPGPRDAYRWYNDSHTRYGPPEALTVARLPIIATGVVGCVGLFLCGGLIGGRRVAVLGALLLVVNPLYRLHAHRAMSDVPCEAFSIAALTLALWGVRRLWAGLGHWSGLAGFAAAGLSAGLAILCKFNGFLATMVIAAWCGSAVLLSKLDIRSKLTLAAGAAATIAAALALVLALNPAFTARADVSLIQYRRLRRMIDIRLDASRVQQKNFEHNALKTLPERLPVFAVQGFGRFGPLGPSKSESTVRFDPAQDWGLVLWCPLVVLGVVQTVRLGRRQLADGRPPTAIALLIWAAVAWAVVAAYLPMAWDRYLLPIQAPNALLAAVGVHGLWERLRGKAVEA
jgi:4-amino-4-deoxy-L-arabinose transferase-like glycosyltransferase